MEGYRAQEAAARRARSWRDRALVAEADLAAAERRVARWQAKTGDAREQLREAVSDCLRVSELADFIQRDRREPDKVLAYTLELRTIALRLAGGR